MKWPAPMILMFTLLLAGCAGAESSPENPPTVATGSTAQPSPTPNVPSETAVSESSANADVIFVRAVKSERGSWTFHVTVQHPDTGWDDYADGWDVVLPDGTVVKPDSTSPFTRLLTHPHQTEQPFTRSQGGLTIPEGVDIVTVRAHDLLDGFGGQEITVDLAQSSGPGFEVEKAAP